ncbi:MAG TPA: hypothetical protein VJO14_01380 [Bacteroidota bacterium]|nr:hypothetical protein [Bacteroidota bacterium]
MASLRGSRTTAIGLYADGYELKLAKLSLRQGHVVIDELQSTTLAQKIEEKRSAAAVELTQLNEAPDTFALPTSAEADAEGAANNNSILLSLLSKYPTSGYVLGYAISEPSIYYHQVESDFGMKGKKLKRRVADELRMVRPVEPTLDSIDFFHGSDKGLMCVVREEGMTMLRLLEEVKPFLGKRLPRIALIEDSDVALLNLARSNYAFNPDDITAIVYIGVEFTRLIFMRGSEFLHFAPILGEGYDSPNVQNTVYSRLLLEQDNMGIARIDRVLLAGECGRIGFDSFLREQLSDVEVQYMRTQQLNTSALPPEAQDQVPEYAVPIATAWKILDENKKSFYPLNLLPDDVREGQKTFKLAWHGYALLALIFIASFLFTSRYGAQKGELGLKNSTLTQLAANVAENEKIKVQINGLNEQIARYNTALAIYDSLVPGAERWNRMVATLTKGVADIGSLWITEMMGMPDGTTSISGYSMSRNRIPRIAALFENATLSRVEVKEIREKSPAVYNFTINVPPQEAQKKDEAAQKPGGVRQ